MFEEYDAQVKLVLACLPTVAKFENFALKGGTAINMFANEQFPRLSVDIDLSFVRVLDRNDFLKVTKKGEPNWEYLNLPHVQNLPGIKWKLMNLQKLDKEKSKTYLQKLEAVLYA